MGAKPRRGNLVKPSRQKEMTESSEYERDMIQTVHEQDQHLAGWTGQRKEAEQKKSTAVVHT